jgi:hypothetical protein
MVFEIMVLDPHYNGYCIESLLLLGAKIKKKTTA